MKKWTMIVGYVVIILLAYIYRTPLIGWIENKEVSFIPLSTAILTFLAIFPVIPFTVAAGLMGAKYGIVVGGLINLAASWLASIIMFVAFRYGFKQEGERLLHRWKVLERFTVLVEKNAFMAVLFARLIPIMPAMAVNLYAAVIRIRLSIFSIASLLGKIPVMIVFAVIGDQLFKSPLNIVFVLVGYSLFIYVSYIFYRKWNHIERT